MGDGGGDAVGECLDIEFTRSGGFAGLVLSRYLRAVELDDDDVAVWLTGDGPSCELADPQPDRFVYELVFHTGEGPHTVVMPEQQLDDVSRPLIERLTELAGAPDSI